MRSYKRLIPGITIWFEMLSEEALRKIVEIAHEEYQRNTEAFDKEGAA